MNIKLFHYVFALSRNPIFVNLALFFSYHLVFAVIAVLGSWSIFFASKKLYSFLLLFFSGGGAMLVAYILKITFLMHRPYVELSDIVPLVKVAGFSFPSGHAALMAGLATAGFFLDRRLGAVLVVFALFTGVSRIVIGVHYPVDVVGGWAVGFLVGIGAFFLLKNL